jgi:hypothetical protein
VPTARLFYPKMIDEQMILFLIETNNILKAEETCLSEAISGYTKYGMEDNEKITFFLN